MVAPSMRTTYGGSRTSAKVRSRIKRTRSGALASDSRPFSLIPRPLVSGAVPILSRFPSLFCQRPFHSDRTRRKDALRVPVQQSQKAPSDAYEEIKIELEALAETTLLFLSNLESVYWQIGSELTGQTLRIKHSDNHIEVLKEIGQERTHSCHFLRFSTPVVGLPRQTVSIAFAWFPTQRREVRPCATAVEATEDRSDRRMCCSVLPCRKRDLWVAFPSSRAFRTGIEPLPASRRRPRTTRCSNNSPDWPRVLFTQSVIWLLTGEFLAVLPNPQDLIPPRYQPIRGAIINEMKEEALTPTYAKSHAPAKYLVQGRAPIKRLLSEAVSRFSDG